MAVVDRTVVERPRFPVVDAHNHLGRWLTGSGDWMIADVDDLLRRMDRFDVETVVNLDGRWGDELQKNLDRYDRAHPGRFVTFCHVDWSLLATAGSSAPLVVQLEASVEAGAGGLKVWKDLGLRVRDSGGALVAPDDQRVIDVVRAAGRLGLPALIHTADPKAFFEPLDRRNERIEELTAHPDWWFGATGTPGFGELLEGFDRLVAACPETTIIGAHVGNCAEDLAFVAGMLDRHANYHVDLGARMGELGRQPRAARRLLVEHADRVLFGTDDFPLADEHLRLWYRFLETADECFDYAPDRDIPPQGRWQVSALDLPDVVLRKIYHENARRVLGLACRS